MVPDLGRELLYRYARTGSQQVESSLDFQPDGILYSKKVHCDLGEGCPDPEHRVPTFWHFITGAERHCPACERPEHRVWRTLCRHPHEAATCDMFAALYLTKADGLTVGGPPRTMRCVADFKLWDIAFRAVARETVVVPAGTFEAMRIEIQPTPANEATRPLEFRGPFGLGSDMTLWVEPQRRLLVKVAGTAHLSVAVRAEMCLARIPDL